MLTADGARPQRTVHLPAQRVDCADLHLFQGEEIFYLLGKSGDAGTTWPRLILHMKGSRP